MNATFSRSDTATDHELPKAPSQKAPPWRTWARGALAIVGALWLTMYLVFRISYINTTPALIVFALLLFVAELDHSILHMYGMFYSLWPRQYQTWPRTQSLAGVAL